MAEDDSIEETNSGVKKKGNWKEIAEFGEEVEDALENSDEDSLEKFGDWRPKVEESESDVKRKTVDEAVLEKKEVEDSEGVKKDLKQASDKIAEAGEKVAEKQVPNKEIIEASGEATKPLLSRIISLVRKVEEKIYSWITLRFNPYYLDTDDFSVDVENKKDGEFEMDVAVLEEEKREDLKDNFREDE